MNICKCVWDQVDGDYEGDEENTFICADEVSTFGDDVVLFHIDSATPTSESAPEQQAMFYATEDGFDDMPALEELDSADLADDLLTEPCMNSSRI